MCRRMIIKEKEDINALDEIHKGACMGKDAIHFVREKVEDQKLKDVLDAEYEENLLRIVELEPSNTKFSEALLDYYYNTKNFTEFNKLFAKVSGAPTV